MINKIVIEEDLLNTKSSRKSYEKKFIKHEDRWLSKGREAKGVINNVQLKHKQSLLSVQSYDSIRWYIASLD